MTDDEPEFATPGAAEEAFYRALQNHDLSLMMTVWDEDEKISCVHPGGRRLQGLAAVRQGWEQIFSLATHMAFLAEADVFMQHMYRQVLVVVE